jgi:hypothetical protein
MEVELYLDGPEEICSETFDIKACQRAWIPTLIDGEMYNIEYGVQTHSNGTGDYIVTDVWIEQLDGAPEFKLTDEMKKVLEEVILSANEK